MKSFKATKEQSNLYSSQAKLLDQMGLKNEARDCFLKHLSIEEAQGKEEFKDFIFEGKQLCDRGYRCYKERDFVNAIACYEKAFYKVEPFINSDTYLKFLIMLNIIWISFKDRRKFQNKEEKFVRFYISFAYRRDPAITVLLISELIKIFHQRRLDNETDALYEEIFDIIGKNENNLDVLRNGFESLLNYCYIVRKQNRSALAIGLFKKANWVFNKLTKQNAITQKMIDDMNKLVPSCCNFNYPKFNASSSHFY